jgi:hypothetical protein
VYRKLRRNTAASGMVGIEVITKIANRVCDGEGIPDEWRCSVLVPLYKGKGMSGTVGAYRGVKLLEHAMKVVKRVSHEVKENG